MTARRRRLREDLPLRGLSPRAQPCYLEAVRPLAQHDRRAPAPISAGGIRPDSRDLIHERQVGARTWRIHLDGLRFFTEHTRQRPGPVFERSRPRPRQKLPVGLRAQAVRSLLALAQRSTARLCRQML
jgi:Phage integrase, N-terminal SAM-like domain